MGARFGHVEFLGLNIGHSTVVSLFVSPNSSSSENGNSLRIELCLSCSPLYFQSLRKCLAHVDTQLKINCMNIY